MNRGPAAGAENRAALIAAAREIFAEQGVDAPLSAIAKRAGVGQGSLYRHFPTRGAIAGAAFDANVADIDQCVADGGTLADVLLLVEQQATSSSALIYVVLHNSNEAHAEHLQQRMQVLITATLNDGIAAGTVPAHFSSDDVMLCIRLVSSVLTASNPHERTALVRRGWQLLGVRLD